MVIAALAALVFETEFDEPRPLAVNHVCGDTVRIGNDHTFTPQWMTLCHKSPIHSRDVAMRTIIVLLSITMLASVVSGQEPGRYAGPIIDMHLHAYTIHGTLRNSPAAIGAVRATDAGGVAGARTNRSRIAGTWMNLGDEQSA